MVGVAQPFLCKENVKS